MKVYLVSVVIIDHDNVGENGIRHELQNANYGNDCINPHVVNVESRDIGEWHDGHPLNCRVTAEQELNRLFGRHVGGFSS